jgi:hypothetical protein
MRFLVPLTLAAGLLAGCWEEDTYTLYRSSPAPALGESARLHVATFDAAGGGDYNRQNCGIAQELFQQQPGVKVRYWCEKGRFHG